MISRTGFGTGFKNWRIGVHCTVEQTEHLSSQGVTAFKRSPGWWKNWLPTQTFREIYTSFPIFKETSERV